ncbi:MAG: 2-amino-4-hydroxy-6-hydroxymethyldihydropteridine diphosphokinase [Succinivibrionaceae bacterium]
MNVVYLALGSNICRNVSFAYAINNLKNVLHKFSFSSLYESIPLHSKGPNFYNAVIKAETDLSLNELLDYTKRLECNLGRYPWYDADGNVYNIRCLDIDILIFNDVVSEYPQLPREDIYKYPFVIIPFAEIEPNFIPLNSDKNMQALADSLDKIELKKLNHLSLHDFIL